MVIGVEAAEKVPIVGSWWSFAFPLGLMALVPLDAEAEVDAAGGGGVGAAETTIGDGIDATRAGSDSSISFSLASRRSNASVTDIGVGIVSARQK